jgi:hypothetical protein
MGFRGAQDSHLHSVLSVSTLFTEEAEKPFLPPSPNPIRLRPSYYLRVARVRPATEQLNTEKEERRRRGRGEGNDLVAI